MDTKQPDALRIANTALQVRNKDTPDDVYAALVDCAWALRNLHAENERLRAGYDATRHEIANLQERVQQLGQLARDVNSRRVVELEAQLEAVGAGGVEPLRKRECLHQISEPAQAQPVDLEPVAAQSRFLTEKGWGTCTLEHHLYVKANPVEWPGYETRALYAAPQPAAQAAPEDASARFKAQHEFLIWNREQTPSPIESAAEYSVFNQAVDFYIAARAAQEGK